MMKKALIALSISLLGFPALLLLLALGPAAPAQAQTSPTIHYVAPGAHCAAFEPFCYASVQAAVDAAAPGDEIRVAAGVYTDINVRPRADALSAGVVTQTVYLSKTLTLRGGYSSDFSAWDPAAYVTTLDAQGHGRGLYIVGDIAPTVAGLRITGGNAAGMGGYVYVGDQSAGGGIYVMQANVNLLHNQIVTNTAAYGGGVFLTESAGRLFGNQILGNAIVSGGGGGVFAFRAPVTLEENVIDGNTSDNIAGGVYLFDSDAALHANQISANSTRDSGGGVSVASCSPTLSANLIAGNSAWRGGGLILWYSQSDLTNNVIVDNSASTAGSGLWIGGSWLTLQHTTIVRNGAGDGSGVFVGDMGAGPSVIAMTNTIFSDQMAGLVIGAAGSSANVAGVLWHNTPIAISGSGVVTVTQEYEGDAAFADDGYHLTAGSAAIDRGLPAGARTDIDGQTRALGIPDLGADEFWAAGLPRVYYLPAIRR